MTVLAMLAIPSLADAQLVPNLGGQRAGISAFQFLKIGVGARGVAMGESFVAVVNDASAMYWNPAGLAEIKGNQVFASHTEYVVDISHEFFGVTYGLGGGGSAIGLSVSALHMDDMQTTTETQPFGTGRYFTFGDVAVGLTYAMKMTDQFSFGVTVRYVNETLDVLNMRSMMVDLGTMYWTGLGSARFAVAISNFGADAEPTGRVTHADGTITDKFQSFSLPTIFKLGIAMEAYETEDTRVTTSLQLNHPNDNSEHFRFGVEYGYRNTFFLRGGLKRTIGQPIFGADETSSGDLTVGAGVALDVAHLSRVQADYAFARVGDLGSTHRISISFSY
jgi:long-subunit fatty acid transport protein